MVYMYICKQGWPRVVYGNRTTIGYSCLLWVESISRNRDGLKAQAPMAGQHICLTISTQRQVKPSQLAYDTRDLVALQPTGIPSWRAPIDTLGLPTGPRPQISSRWCHMWSILHVHLGKSNWCLRAWRLVNNLSLCRLISNNRYR